MAKYYKASEVQAILKKLAKEPYYQHQDEDFYAGICAFDGELMSLDTVELKESKWVFKKYVGEDYYSCASCGTDYKLPETWSKYDVGCYCKYCSSCGAKMI